MNETEKPKQLDRPDFEALKKLCGDYMTFLDSEDYHEDNDYDHYIYEAAMQAIYGEKVWDYIKFKDMTFP